MASVGNQTMPDLQRSKQQEPSPPFRSPDPSRDEMPKVLMFAFAFPPMAVAGTFRTLRFVRYLPDFGWNPLVLTIKPEQIPDIPLDPALSESLSLDTIVQRTSVLRPIANLLRKLKDLKKREEIESASTTAGEASPSPAQKPFPRWQRRLQAVKQGLIAPFSIPDRHIGWTIPALRAARRLVRTHKPDLLYSTGPPHSSHLIAVLAKQLTGLPLVLDFRDPWAHRDWESDEGPLKTKSERWLERYCVHRADAVILNTESLCEQFRQNYPSLQERFHTITNGYDPDLRRKIEQLLATQAERTSSARSEFRLCHAGSVYGARKLQPVVAAIAKLNHKGYSIVLEQVGPVGAEANLQEFMRQHQAEGFVQLRGRQPHQIALKCMAAADALLILQPGTAIQIPGKLFEMLLFNKPILAVAHSGETSKLMQRYNLGPTAIPENQDELEASIEQLLLNRGKNSTSRQKPLQDFNGQKLTGKLADILAALIRTSKTQTQIRTTTKGTNLTKSNG